ncbi:MAG: type I-C CRISPR-associated protein Cas5c [Acidobacteriota bacterium]
MTRDGRSPIVALRARGPFACFTRPELKAERVSYVVPTPSAARGLIEAVLWKPAIRWHIERIRVLAPIRSIAFRRNEVNSRAVAPAAKVIAQGGTAPHLYADQDRAQRNTIALRDVDYVIEARFSFTAKAGADDNMGKFLDMFRRRVRQGQAFQQPYLGCREFAAEILSPEGAPEPIDDSRDLGLMLWDIDFGKVNRPRFFAARLEAGVLEVPDDPESTLAMLGASA